ncbi:MAG: hypothetical protein JW958_11540 [Candidatus Eisenbacteria bacterium]|nr:hypothetical protein [Candidatus Eisenbacteria bacterium]
MGLLEEARERLRALLRESGFDGGAPVEVTPLHPDDAIGARADENFVLKKGKERVIEARIGGARGQAFTDRPTSWRGTPAEALRLDLSRIEDRAVFTAVLNGALRMLGRVEGTVHCRDEDPTRCGPLLAEELERRFGAVRIGMVGLQPAILRGLVERFGAERVRVVDRNPDNIGAESSGVPVWDGDREMERLVDSSDIGLITGSSVVNGTADEIIRLFRDAGKPYLLFGNTVAGVAALLDLPRICPLSG